MSYPNWVFTIFAGLGVMLSTIPLPWHLEAWNTGTCLFMVWTALGCLNQFINSIVWANDAINYAPVWCDISTKFMVGYSVGIPCASLCINRRLYHIATANTVTVTKAEKRRAIMVDLAIGVGIPVLEMVLHYIPQGHRFDIYEQIGCFPHTYNTPVAFVLVYSWQVIIGLVSAVYCILSIRAFNKRRLQFKELLSGNNNLNSNRYFRLMCLAGVEVVCMVPLGCWAMYLDVKQGVYPWLGWADTHYGFSRVDQIPAMLWRKNSIAVSSLEISRWAPIIGAIVFFAFFGFADEAIKHYRTYINSVAKRVGYSTMGTDTLTGSTSNGSKWKGSIGKGSLPVFIRKETTQKRDSLDSFTSGGSFSETKEKSFGGAISFGAISLADCGGALADYKPEIDSPVSSSSSSSSSSAGSIHESDFDDDHIEISSVRRASRVPSMIIPRAPEPAFISGAPRHAADAPTPVGRNSLDIV